MPQDNQKFKRSFLRRPSGIFCRILLLFIIGFFLSIGTYFYLNEWLSSELEKTIISDINNKRYFKQEFRDLQLKHAKFWGEDTSITGSEMVSILLYGENINNWSYVKDFSFWFPYLSRNVSSKTNLDVLRDLINQEQNDTTLIYNEQNYIDNFQILVNENDFAQSYNELRSKFNTVRKIGNSSIINDSNIFKLYDDRSLKVLDIDSSSVFNFITEINAESNNISKMYSEYINKLVPKRIAAIQDFAKTIDKVMGNIRKSHYYKARIYINGGIQFSCFILSWVIIVSLLGKFVIHIYNRNVLSKYLAKSYKSLGEANSEDNGPNRYSDLAAIPSTNSNYSTRPNITILDWYRVQKENFIEEINGLFDLEKNLISLVAIIGFIGTVTGILNTLPESSKVFTNDGVEIKKALSQEITFSLGIAFDTTLIALVLSLFLMLLLYLISYINRVGVYIIIEKIERRIAQEL